MHLQPQFAGAPLVSRTPGSSVAARLFERGVCLPSGRMPDNGRDRIERAMAPLLAGATVSEFSTSALRTVEVRDLYLTTDPDHPHRYLRLHAAPDR